MQAQAQRRWRELQHAALNFRMYSDSCSVVHKYSIQSPEEGLCWQARAQRRRRELRRTTLYFCQLCSSNSKCLALQAGAGAAAEAGAAAHGAVHGPGDAAGGGARDGVLQPGRHGAAGPPGGLAAGLLEPVGSGIRAVDLSPVLSSLSCCENGASA